MKLAQAAILALSLVHTATSDATTCPVASASLQEGAQEGTHEGGEPGTAIATPFDDAALGAEVAGLAAALAERRGFKLGDPLGVSVLPPAEFRAALIRQVTELHPADHFENVERSYAMLGLLVRQLDVNLVDQVVDGLATSIYGLYSPTSKRILIPEGFTDTAFGEAQSAAMRTEILAHEIHHGLQDRRWDLSKLVGRSVRSHDRRLASGALMEGDAVATAFDLMLSKTDSGFLEWDGDLGMRITESIEISAVMHGAESGSFHDTTIHAFMYGQGSAFVQHLTKAGGWAHVEAAFDDPPDSTEQVLHPEKYSGVRDYPVDLPLTVPPGLAEAGWEVRTSDVLGELNLSLLFEGALDEVTAMKASFGWDGDRYLLLGKDGHRALLWVSQWDSSRDARAAGEAFAEAYDLAAVEGQRGRSLNLDRMAGAAHLQVHRNRVALVVDIPEALVDEALAAAMETEAVYHPKDETRGRGDSKVTRRLEREAQARIEAASVVLEDQVVSIRELGLSFPVPSPEWSLGDRSVMPILKALVIRNDPTVNLNVTTAPVQGLTRDQTIQATLDSLVTIFGDFEVISQTTHEDEQGPGFDLRFSGNINGQVAHLWQRGFLRGDHYVVLTATNIGGPIEGDIETEFGLMLDGAKFED